MSGGPLFPLEGPAAWFADLVPQLARLQGTWTATRGTTPATVATFQGYLVDVAPSQRQVAAAGAVVPLTTPLLIAVGSVALRQDDVVSLGSTRLTVVAIDATMPGYTRIQVRS